MPPRIHITFIIGQPIKGMAMKRMRDSTWATSVKLLRQVDGVLASAAERAIGAVYVGER